MLNVDIIDKIVKVSNDDAFDTAKRLMREEDIMCGIHTRPLISIDDD